MKEQVEHDPAREYRTIMERRRSGPVPVDQPMVLITQAPRSGGTMLMHLFDGHPECHVFPVECRIRFGRRFRDPAFAGPWSLLHHSDFDKQFYKGVPHARRELHGDTTRHPLLLPPSLLRAMFDERETESSTERELLDAYLTSFFNAWLDNQNLYTAEPKKWVVAFTPRMIAREEKLKHFRELYPNGRIVSIVRDPLTWYCSARLWSNRGEWTDLSEAMDYWQYSAEQTLERKQEQGDAMIVVSFEDLLGRTHETMDILARYLDIRFDPGLTQPTFNRLPVRANSSFDAGEAQVNAEPLRRHEDELKPADVEFVRDRNWELYERVLSVASRPVDTRPVAGSRA